MLPEPEPLEEVELFDEVELLDVNELLDDSLPPPPQPATNASAMTALARQIVRAKSI